MILFLIIGICVGALAVDFAMQNTAPVTVALFPWHFSAPLSLIILGAVAVGLLMAVLMMLPTVIRESLDTFAYQREIRRQREYEAANSTSAKIAA